MSSQPIEPSCDTCHKSQSELPNPLKCCAKCKKQRYCSRDCQKEDWRGHKLLCSSSAADNASSATSSANTTKGLCYITKPFTALSNGTWLHNRPEKDVFKLLVDTYRMRIEDQYKLSGDVEEGSLYSGASPARALSHFRRFLIKVTEVDQKREKKLLPEWWSQTKLKECLQYAKNDDFSNVAYAVEKSDIQDHYKWQIMPMQLRMFSEKLDGTLAAGTSCEMMLQMQVQAESGGLRGTNISL